MAERFSEIEKSSRRETSLEERLKEYPELKAKIETMLSIIENSGGDVEKAAEADRLIVNVFLHGLARHQHQKSEPTRPSPAAVCCAGAKHSTERADGSSM